MLEPDALSLHDTWYSGKPHRFTDASENLARSVAEAGDSLWNTKDPIQLEWVDESGKTGGQIDWNRPSSFIRSSSMCAVEWGTVKGPPKMELSDANSRALSRTGFWIMVILHGLAGLLLPVILAGFHSAQYGDFFARLYEKGELPVPTEFAIAISPYLPRLLPLGFAADAAVLYVLGRLPRRHRWLVVAWFSLVLFDMIAIDVVTHVGLILPTL